MDIYLTKNQPPRGLVKDLTTFKHIPSSNKVSKTSKKGGKTAEEPVAIGSKEIPSLTEFLTEVNWSSDSFVKEYNATYDLMEMVAAQGASFTRDHRLSEHLGTRILSMNTIYWNANSRYRSRDWAVLAATVTVETATVGLYRKELLEACFGALDLRSALHALFSSVTAPHKIKAIGTKKGMTEVRIWEFADNLPHSHITLESNVYDPQRLKEDWEAAHAGSIKGKKDIISGAIQYLEKIKYLNCSDPAEPGSIETLAHHLITALAEVGFVMHKSLLLSHCYPSDHV
jgi:hypothetical protein